MSQEQPERESEKKEQPRRGSNGKVEQSEEIDQGQPQRGRRGSDGRQELSEEIEQELLREEVTENGSNQGKLKKNRLREEAIKRKSILEEEVTKKKRCLEEGGTEE